MWYAILSFQSRAVLWNGYSMQWNKWTKRHRLIQITETENYLAQCTVRITFIISRSTRVELHLKSTDGGDDVENVLVAAFQRYCVSNPLHPDVFPAVRKMEAEIVAMCLRMYNNPTGAGATTSGGTESILMSVKTHRDWARTVKGISEPEMHVSPFALCYVLTRLVHRVVPASAHAAFDKAAAYFNIKLHSIPVDSETRQVDMKRVRRAMSVTFVLICSPLTSSSETQILSWSCTHYFSVAVQAHHKIFQVVGSAINFPDGCQDDIVLLGRLAKKYNIGLHVDCCLGSFIMPFLEKAGFSSKPFDFRVEGVTAISCDTHKVCSLLQNQGY